MKKLNFFLLLALPFFLNACFMNSSYETVSGNGKVVEETRDLAGFTGVKVSAGIDVLLSQADDFSVRVEADENLIALIETRIDGDLLEVGTDQVNIRNAKAKRVHVCLPELRKLRINSAGDCIGQNAFECGDLQLDINSAGDLRLELEAKHIDLNISSSGDCRLSGACDHFDADLSSAGDLDAYDLVAKVVEVSVSSAGDARVHATDEISMQASSAGSIYYRGNPKVVLSNASSGGEIVKRD